MLVKGVVRRRMPTRMFVVGPPAQTPPLPTHPPTLPPTHIHQPPSAGSRSWRVTAWHRRQRRQPRRGHPSLPDPAALPQWAVGVPQAGSWVPSHLPPLHRRMRLSRFDRQLHVPFRLPTNAAAISFACLPLNNLILF